MSVVTDGGSPAPIDRPILEYVRDRLESTGQFDRVELADPDEHLELRAVFAADYYPDDVTEAVLFVRWYTNDDFKIHYREQYAATDWQCRWDRHPNPHNTRDHFHPPPNADTPGADETWHTDYRDVIQQVLDEIQDRIRELWDQ